ncbi:PrsW family intramembrane metalloprotease [Oculatella sp. LEGE 06141]|uniref:PrsW family intramembrane metalloprotease n=1 Tax=Oculatella sp. LEGE 06141 TaxID=1828648 RepID=UPI00187F813B|nr:PrsW family glutamic-type intramembrane protease [Oculatella sp. LEGE 06141]MBE9177750.1 PrsW family intramembrane metalloprotease [Oculatella sp. LEGE 06141]
MAQPDLFELARQGDPGAIATLLNRSLQPRGVEAKLLLRENCLKILLVSARPLEQQAFIQFLHQQISRLQPQTIQRVKVYAQRTGEDTATWYQEFVPGQDANLIAIANEDAGVNSKSESAAFWVTLRSFRLATVFPYQDVLGRELYQNATVKLLLFFALFPLLVDLVSDWASLAQAAWLLGIYYACIWGVVLHHLIKPRQFSWQDTLKCILFTVFIGIPLLLMLQQVPPFRVLYGATRGGFIFRMFGFVLGVGVLEELCKALPVYLFLLRLGKLHDPLTSAFYGAMSGLGFAIAEGVTYSLLYALGLTRGEIGLGAFVVANTIRFVSLPLFHAILAGIVGYFIGLAAINPSRQWAILLIGVAIAAILHGLYDSFAGSILGLLVIGFTILLFAAYIRRSKEMVRQMQQAEYDWQELKQRP